ncbi:uncharacterized protein B4U79_16820, partial [Dinothrombium tinctorium]
MERKFGLTTSRISVAVDFHCTQRSLSEYEDIYMKMNDVEGDSKQFNYESTNIYEEIKPPLDGKPWFFGRLSKPEAKRILTPFENGLFIIYESENKQSEYTLAVCYGEIVHYFELENKNGMILIEKDREFSDIEQLIEFYSNGSKLTMIPPLVKSPVKRCAKIKPQIKPKPKFLTQKSGTVGDVKKPTSLSEDLCKARYAQPSDLQKKLQIEIKSFLSPINSEDKEIDSKKDKVAQKAKKLGINVDQLSEKELNWLTDNDFDQNSFGSKSQLLGRVKSFSMATKLSQWTKNFERRISGENRRHSVEIDGQQFISKSETSSKVFNALDDIADDSFDEEDNKEENSKKILDFHYEPLYQHSYFTNESYQRTLNWLLSSESVSDSSGIYSDIELHSNEKTENSIIRDTSTPALGKILWIHVPKVKDSGKISQLSESEIKLQEAMYEVMSSETSYVRSLQLLVNHFYKNIEVVKKYQKLITEEQFNNLFSNIKQITLVSEEILSHHEERWNGQILMHDVCDVLKWHYLQKLEKPYLTYCENH